MSDNVDLGEDRLFALGWGLVYKPVCAPAHWTREQIEDEATRMDPPGTTFGRWVVSDPHKRDDDWNGANCVDCPDDPKRKHWLLNC